MKGPSSALFTELFDVDHFKQLARLKLDFLKDQLI